MDQSVERKKPALRGRKRGLTPEQLARAIDAAEIDEVTQSIDRYIRLGADPLRDKMTHKYEFFPNPRGAKQYVEGGVRRAFKNQTATSEAEKADLKARKERSHGHIVEGTQTVTWINKSVAQFRQLHLSQALEAISFGEDVSPDNATYAADAVEDFGFSVMASKNFSKRLGFGDELGAGIVKLGRQMSTDPTLLTQHTFLLRTIVQEQEKREEFWDGRLGAMIEAFGNQLDPEDLLTEGDLEAMFNLREETERELRTH